MKKMEVKMAKTYTQEEYDQAVEKAVREALGKKGWSPEQLAERDAELERRANALDEQIEALADKSGISPEILKYGFYGKPSSSNTGNRGFDTGREAKREVPIKDTVQGGKSARQLFSEFFREKTEKSQSQLATEGNIDFENLDPETQREIEIWELAQRYGADPVMLKDMDLSVEETEEELKSEGYVEIPEPTEEAAEGERSKNDSQDSQKSHLVTESKEHWPFFGFHREPNKSTWPETLTPPASAKESRIYGSGNQEEKAPAEAEQPEVEEGNKGVD
jgi:hypothetical protein